MPYFDETVENSCGYELTILTQMDQWFKAASSISAFLHFSCTYNLFPLTQSHLEALLAM